MALSYFYIVYWKKEINPISWNDKEAQAYFDPYLKRIRMI